MSSPKAEKGANEFARKRFILPQTSLVCQGLGAHKTGRPVGCGLHLEESKRIPLRRAQLIEMMR
jgi:hypothetical protein